MINPTLIARHLGPIPVQPQELLRQDEILGSLDVEHIVPRLVALASDVGVEGAVDLGIDID